MWVRIVINTAMKYTASEKHNILEEWFETDNIIKKPLKGLPRYNSMVDDDIIKNNKLIYELLELEGPDCIRFAVARNCDCTCQSVAADFEDIVNLHELTGRYIEDVKNRGLFS
jgi:hypothetical protein